MRRRGVGTLGSSVTILGEQSDIRSYQPFTSYPPLSNFSFLPTLALSLAWKTRAENLRCVALEMWDFRGSIIQVAPLKEILAEMTY